MSPTRRTARELPIPSGVWRVVREQSEIGFAVKGNWGLQTVKGVFGTFDGALSVVNGGANGQLTIEAASLDTGNARRDQHLRSAAFFDVERYRRVVFTTTAVDADEEGLIVSGDLTVGPSQVNLQLPVEVEHGTDGAVRLRGGTNVSREAVGLDWNILGMIRGHAKLHARLMLTPASS
jgi:polyisoprenoid-binding protein YceI